MKQRENWPSHQLWGNSKIFSDSSVIHQSFITHPSTGNSGNFDISSSKCLLYAPHRGEKQLVKLLPLFDPAVYCFLPCTAVVAAILMQKQNPSTHSALQGWRKVGYSRARTCCACSRWGRGGLVAFFSPIYPVFLFLLLFSADTAWPDCIVADRAVD